MLEHQVTLGGQVVQILVGRGAQRLEHVIVDDALRQARQDGELRGFKPDMQTGALPANAIRTNRTKTLHRQTVCKTATPSALHAVESCFPGDVHVRLSLGFEQPKLPTNNQL